MALAPLATVADLEARGMTVETAEEPLVTTYLGVASTAVREAAGGPVSQTTSTVTLEGGPGQWLTLPGQPVTEVTTVLIEGESVTDWRLVSGRLWRGGGWARGCGLSAVDVTQTHGLPDVPEDIVDLVSRMAAGALTAQRSEADGMGLAATKTVTSERIGDYAVTYGNDGRITEMELPQHWRERLAARFGGGLTALRSR